MVACIAKAAERNLAFQVFSLQDCRPKAVTEKLARGDTNTMEASLHTNEQMIREVYDRRRVRSAKPME